MTTRQVYSEQLNDLREKTIALGRMVEEHLKLSLKALEKSDVKLAKQVRKADKKVNAARFAIEDECTSLIALQQPVLAGDLRVVLAMMYVIVDLERIGDKTKSIAKAVIRLGKGADVDLPAIGKMGDKVVSLLEQSLQAFENDNIDLAKQVIAQDDKVDRLFSKIIGQLSEEHHDEFATDYQILTIARALERCGDLSANVAERVIYIATGKVADVDVDLDDILEEYLQ
jgi:phosphate transport system protein